MKIQVNVVMHPSRYTDTEGAADFEIAIDDTAAAVTLIPCECCAGKLHGLVSWGNGVDVWLSAPGVKKLAAIATPRTEDYRAACTAIVEACNAELASWGI